MVVSLTLGLGTCARQACCRGLRKLARWRGGVETSGTTVGLACVFKLWGSRVCHVSACVLVCWCVGAEGALQVATPTWKSRTDDSKPAGCFCSVAGHQCNVHGCMRVACTVTSRRLCSAGCISQAVYLCASGVLSTCPFLTHVCGARQGLCTV